MSDEPKNPENSTTVNEQAPEVSKVVNNKKTTKTEKSARTERPFRVGDKVVVNYRIVEGTKSRVQPYEGIVIGIKGGGVSKTFTVRRMAAANIGVERIFPMHSPNIESVSVKTKGAVRRAKLYYLRDRTGKAASKIKER